MTRHTGTLRVPLALLGVFLVVFVALGIAPAFRNDWLLENLVVLLLTLPLVLTVRRLRFSNFAYACIFVFLVLHEIGAHYTYSLVPYDRWWEALTGTTLSANFGWQRNHYDRLLHFLYGLLMLPAACELMAAMAPGRGLWRALPAVTFLWSHAALYEILEWAAAMTFGGELGLAYLGTQGDVWDAQRDMALHLLGTLCGVPLVLRTGTQRRTACPAGSASPPPPLAATTID